MRAGGRAKLVGLEQVVRGDRDEMAVAHFHLVKELDEALVLAAILRAEPPATQDDDERVVLLELRELPVRSGLIGQLVVGERRACHDVFSHASDGASLREEGKSARSGLKGR